MNLLLIISELFTACVHHGESAHKSQPLYCPNANSNTLYFGPHSQEQRCDAHIPAFKSTTLQDQDEI